MSALKKAHIDFETRSELNISDVGAYKYAEHHSTEILCAVYKIPGGDYTLWKPFDENPEDLFRHLREGGVITAHNAFFEQCIWRFIAAPQWGWPKIKSVALWRCSAAKAASFALPRALGPAGRALRLPVTKNEDGKRVMLKLSQPRKPTKTDNSKWHYKQDDFETLYSYCRTDVASEEAIDHVLRDLKASEQELWFYDQIINFRGVKVDMELVNSAISIMEGIAVELEAELKEKTNGAVNTVSEIERMVSWIQNQGVQIPDLTANTVERYLNDKDTPPHVRRILEIRQAGSKSSTKKYQAIKRSVCSDGRLHDILLYHAASTGRWGGRVFQPQNLPRGINDLDTEAAITLIKNRDRASLNELAAQHECTVADVLSACIRGALIPDEGKDFLVSDYAAIEARVLAWLANDELLLDLFRNNEPVYEHMAADIYGKPVASIQKPERQLGKQTILGAGYGMGPPKFQMTCEGYGINLTDTVTIDIIVSALLLRKEKAERALEMALSDTTPAVQEAF